LELGGEDRIISPAEMRKIVMERPIGTLNGCEKAGSQWNGAGEETARKTTRVTATLTEEGLRKKRNGFPSAGHGLRKLGKHQEGRRSRAAISKTSTSSRKKGNRNFLTKHWD